MAKLPIALLLTVAMLMATGSAVAQEVEIHTGFVFYAGSYTVDEEKFGMYDDGHEVQDILKEVPAALDAFQSFESWHMTGNVFVGFGLGAAVLGGVLMAPVFKEDLPSNLGLITIAAGGGLIVLGIVFEFISWGKASSAAELYNKEMEVDDGPALKFDPVPFPTVAIGEGGGGFALTWSF